MVTTRNQAHAATPAAEQVPSAQELGIKRKSERLRSPANVKKRRLSEEKNALTSKEPRVVIPVVRRKKSVGRTADSIPSSSAESNAEVLDEVIVQPSHAESEAVQQVAGETETIPETQARISGSRVDITPTKDTGEYDMFAEDSAEGVQKAPTAADTESTPKAQPPVEVLQEEVTASQDISKPEDAVEEFEETPRAESIYATPAAGASSNYATPATHLATSYPDPITGMASSQPSPSKTRAKRLPTAQRKKVEDIATASGEDVQSSNAEPLPTTSQTDGAADHPTPPTPSASKTKHIRFGSEEPSPPTQEVPSSTAFQNPEVTIQAESEDAEPDSESDDAPEAISKSIALSTTRAADLGASLAISAQESAAKDKRRQQEARRKEQADANKKAAERRARKEAKRRAREGEGEIGAETGDTGEVESGNIDPAVPGFGVETMMEEAEDGYLPAALLARAPAVRPPTPEIEGLAVGGKPQQSQQRRKIFAGLNEKPAKDVKRGPVTVKVLEKRNELLPPKANNKSRNIREAWLKGRQGRPVKGQKTGVLDGRMERREVGRGFLRR
ncbi:hypothetical protein LTS18_009565 [Coniosporium uncinatum]|uniref:Uncharacterized protein n=1 Tax=Coniosporium uncinatum TaxID=93489 RepID=A0ACC3DMG9_9PEZI|nr:hypothetical protein LTS18_009565 [Coniosporium uncinatum]